MLVVRNSNCGVKLLVAAVDGITVDEVESVGGRRVEARLE